MTWFRVDDGFGDHPKVDALGDGPCRDAAIALWTLAGAWAARHLTDGHVSAGRVERIGVKNPIKAAAELVRVGLWDATDDGYRFRNWTEYQPTRAKVEAERGKTADRVRRFRTANDAAAVGAVTRDSHRDDEGCNAVTSPLVTPLVTPPPSRPVPTRPVESESLSAREGEHPLAARADAKAEARRHVIREYGAAYEAAYRDMWYPGPHGHALDTIAAWVADQADPATAARELVAAAFAWEPWRRHRVPPKWIADDPGLALSRAKARTSQPDDFSLASTSTEPPF